MNGQSQSFPLSRGTPTSPSTPPMHRTQSSSISSFSSRNPLSPRSPRSPSRSPAPQSPTCPTPKLKRRSTSPAQRDAKRRLSDKENPFHNSDGIRAQTPAPPPRPLSPPSPTPSPHPLSQNDHSNIGSTRRVAGPRPMPFSSPGAAQLPNHPSFRRRQPAPISVAGAEHLWDTEEDEAHGWMDVFAFPTQANIMNAPVGASSLTRIRGEPPPSNISSTSTTSRLPTHLGSPPHPTAADLDSEADESFTTALSSTSAGPIEPSPPGSFPPSPPNAAPVAPVLVLSSPLPPPFPPPLLDHELDFIPLLSQPPPPTYAEDQARIDRQKKEVMAQNGARWLRDMGIPTPSMRGLGTTLHPLPNATPASVPPELPPTTPKSGRTFTFRSPAPPSPMRLTTSNPAIPAVPAVPAVPAEPVELAEPAETVGPAGLVGPATPAPAASPPGLALTEPQLRAVRLAREGRNVFLTGGAGCGKSLVVRECVRELQAAGKKVVVTASTGIAATHVKGRTIHSFAGIGPGLLTKEVRASEKTAVLVFFFGGGGEAKDPLSVE
ncbi:hypothetical protein M427DRAFT_238571 [Gonapodya prolifera JEL478]|uniref:ATP-dependent DNA helicase n=1 Tax=Gonapodya prolifera (strain JEL478) TaxID=1344416 RepID=A0A138ZXW5_GONPJ|nr:hypothetical protein M427DRAFT_238571 [Gonapodya prolifera JEL478]|eukprot:KXS09329.1 hypothetical protein M427DRAFT_238571 [Gonapodya prolifera JEL478]